MFQTTNQVGIFLWSPQPVDLTKMLLISSDFLGISGVFYGDLHLTTPRMARKGWANGQRGMVLVLKRRCLGR